MSQRIQPMSFLTYHNQTKNFITTQFNIFSLIYVFVYDVCTYALQPQLSEALQGPYWNLLTTACIK